MAHASAYLSLPFRLTRGFSFILLLAWSAPANAQTFTSVDTSVVARTGGYSQGGSWGDYDNDGDQDLLVSNGSRTRGLHKAFLFRNDGGWLFTRIIEGDVANAPYAGVCSWGDYDNDDDLDLFCAAAASNTPNRLYRNDGDGLFTRDTTSAVTKDDGDSVSASWSDIDNDGYLDLYVVNDVRQRNYLYHNRGDAIFSRIMEGPLVEEIANNDLVSSWADFDNDGDVDVFVAVNGNNRLYVNQGDGSFEVNTSGGVLNDGNFSASAAWGDYDNDGFLDLFVSNWISTRDLLYRNNGDGSFQKITTSALTSTAKNSSGASWGDFDNDGDLDLLVTSWIEPMSFYRNDGSGIFTRVPSDQFPSDVGGTCSLADIDRDGDLDIFVARGALGPSFGDPLDDLLLENGGTGNSWMNVMLIGTSSNKNGLGARLRASATINGNPTWQIREVAQQNTYGGHHSFESHFGLGDADVVDSLVIRWPSGQVDTHVSVPANVFIVATEGAALSVGAEQQPHPLPRTYVLNQNYPNPFNPSTTIRYELAKSSYTVLAVYDVVGRRIAVLVDDVQPAGVHEVDWTAGALPSGMYIYRIESGDFVNTKSMLLIR